MFVFSPLPLAKESAQDALPEDATCVHHPAKQAISQCEGTGDYICALCSVSIDDRVFSAQYLESDAGKAASKNAFGRYFERPDRAMFSFFAISFLFMPAAPITVALAWYYWGKARHLRRTNPLFARVMSRTHVILSALLLVAATGLILLVAFSILRDIL